MILVDAACPRLSEYVTPPRIPGVGTLGSHDRLTWPAGSLEGDVGMFVSPAERALGSLISFVHFGICKPT